MCRASSAQNADARPGIWVADLITRYGRDEKIFAFTADVTANCARKRARSDSDRCCAVP